MPSGSFISQAELWTRTALVVTHDDVLARLLQFILHGEGYSVQRLAAGVEARNFIEHALPPDLVAVDFLLPDATGVDLLGAMRAIPEWTHVPALIVSAEPQEKMDLTAAGGIGAVAYMEKPARAEELRACVLRLPNQSALYRVHRRASVTLPRHGRRY